jgi:hypothetical protein
MMIALRALFMGGALFHWVGIQRALHAASSAAIHGPKLPPKELQR